jgi:ABC-type transport system involved in multi-copper enzyme maturation permease subunit
MAASFAAEMLKLRKRPATWILLAVWLVFVTLLAYGSTYLFISTAPEDGTFTDGQSADAFLVTLYPENLLSNLLSGGGFVTIGGAIALILAAMAVGGEYGWGTLKTGLTQKPGRLSFLMGKLLALAVVLALFVLAAFAAAAACSFAIARLEGAAVEWPEVGDILRAMGAAGLILAAWAMLGAFLATLFRGTSLAISLGLVYALALEGILFNLPIQNDLYENAREALLGQNSGFLANSFAGDALSEGFAPSEPPVEPTQAALVLGAYAIAFVLLAALFLRRRDVT